MPKRVLLTGASGFVGANLARRLLRDGHEVHLVLRPQQSSWRLQGVAGFEIHTMDLEDSGALRHAVREARPEWVFHLAAHGAYSSQTDVRQMVQTNIVGTINLVDACIETGFESFVNAGSSSEYGFVDHAPSESEALRPNSVYAVTKAAAAQYCGFAARTHGVPIRTLRLYSVYGPWEEPARLIPTLLVYAMHDRLPALVDPKIARDFVYVDDVCDAFLAAAGWRGEVDAVFNVGSGRETTIEQVVGVARRLLKVDAEPQWGSMPNRAWDTTSWVADASRAKRELGWAPRFSLEAGLSATIDWLKSDAELLSFYESRSRRQSRV